jgi:Transposase C of IS166 homeodomain
MREIPITTAVGRRECHQRVDRPPCHLLPPHTDSIGSSSDPYRSLHGRIPEDQLLLGFEEVEQTTASDEADQEATSPATREARAAKRRPNRGSLPSHLPRIEMVVDIEDHRCPCFRRALHVIGEDRAERLEIVPAHSRPAAQISLSSVRGRARAGASTAPPGQNLACRNRRPCFIGARRPKCATLPMGVGAWNFA